MNSALSHNGVDIMISFRIFQRAKVLRPLKIKKTFNLAYGTPVYRDCPHPVKHKPRRCTRTMQAEVSTSSLKLSFTPINAEIRGSDVRAEISILDIKPALAHVLLYTVPGRRPSRKEQPSASGDYGLIAGECPGTHAESPWRHCRRRCMGSLFIASSLMHCRCSCSCRTT